MKNNIYKSCAWLLSMFIGLVGFAQSPQTFNYTGSMQTWVVPAGVTSVHYEAIGASGGGTSNASIAGKGGKVEGDLAVTAGQTLNIFVGQQGVNSSGTNAGVAGSYNGGGAGGSSIGGAGQPGGAAGGGASDIRIGGTALANRLVVAGAGGGTGGGTYSGTANGGDGGGLTGAISTSYALGLGHEATGGSQSAGGAKGSYFYAPMCGGTDGSLGIGGDGIGCGYSGGGGGGGGYYGGGGGSTHFESGGGGGSSYTESASTNVIHTQGFHTGNGEITLTWTGSNPCPTMTLTMGTKGVKNTNFSTHGAGDDMTYYNGISAAKGFDVCVAGGVGPYTAVWSSTDGTISQYGNRCDITGGSKASVIYPTGAFDVSVTVTDANGCSATETMSIGYVDYICSAPGTLWDYLLCEVGTGITSCVPTTSAASAMLATGLYELGSCAPKTGLEAAALSFAVYPSPTNGMATLRYNAVKNTSAQINVLDLNGRVIQSSSIELNKGNVEYGLDLSNVTNGVYFVQLVTENDVQTQKIQVLK